MFDAVFPQELIQFKCLKQYNNLNTAYLITGLCKSSTLQNQPFSQPGTGLTTFYTVKTL